MTITCAFDLIYSRRDVMYFSIDMTIVDLCSLVARSVAGEDGKCHFS